MTPLAPFMVTCRAFRAHREGAVAYQQTCKHFDPRALPGYGRAQHRKTPQETRARDAAAPRTASTSSCKPAHCALRTA